MIRMGHSYFINRKSHIQVYMYYKLYFEFTWQTNQEKIYALRISPAK